MLVSALSVAMISVTEKRASLATDKSSRAFQVADTGVEVMLEKIYKGNPSTLSALGICSNGDVSGGSPDYVVSFYKSDGTKLTDCSDTNWRSQVAKIKSEGTAGNTKRAVEVGIESSEVCLVPSVDYGGDTYTTITIGTQCWMKQNMNVGTQIGASTAQTNNSTIEKYCYSDDSSNCTDPNPPNTQPDGGFYRWDEAMQYSTASGARGICPSGWHIPTDSEWYTLENHLKDTGQTCSTSRSGYDCASAGTKLRSGGMSGFEGNLAGYVNNDSFTDRGATGVWWSSSESGSAAFIRQIVDSNNMTGRGTVVKSQGGLSVRCIQDS